jgi:hypothetical protein
MVDEGENAYTLGLKDGLEFAQSVLDRMPGGDMNHAMIDHEFPLWSQMFGPKISRVRNLRGLLCVFKERR